MKIVIFTNTEKLYAEETAKKTENLLRDKGAEVSRLDINDVISFDPTGTDVIIVIGGDGSILKAAKIASISGIPLLGINTGRLGFMASIERTELPLLSNLIGGDYVISERMRIAGYVVRDGKVISEVTATNEISAIRPVTKITDFEILAGNTEKNRTESDRLWHEGEANFHTVCAFRADGIIIAAPTGSTAYALANGGAIIEPNADCMELTPISAHTLSMRPIIFSGKTLLKVSCNLTAAYSESEPVRVVADGVVTQSLKTGDTLYIKKSDKPLRLIDLKPNAFYESVNGKLFQSLK
ncbi:MAG: NAD(+)/NADH kinase [Ruminococcus sp.]|jgi:NAD+ kinase|nr:NAD(+)/NADH kinase [Ruminococcus sp.]